MQPGNWSPAYSLTALLLAGCAGSAAPVNLSGYSTAFKHGHTDGCESAAARSPRRDEARNKTGPEYKGWNDGYSACGC